MPQRRNVVAAVGRPSVEDDSDEAVWTPLAQIRDPQKREIEKSQRDSHGGCVPLHSGLCESRGKRPGTFDTGFFTV